MIVLAIDTASHMCSTCIYDAGADTVLSEDYRDIGRGHAEILMEQVEACLAASGKTYADLDRISVASGPGSFTGIRVGMAAARGLGLGLDIPVIGISCLEACEADALINGAEQPVLSVLDARRGQYYCKFSEDVEPWIDNSENLVDRFGAEKITLAGSGAADICNALSKKPQIAHQRAAQSVAIYAKLAARSEQPATRPEPVYLRSADAKPQAGFALQRENA